MSKWDYKAIEEAIKEFAPAGDPADPKQRKRSRILRAATELFTKRGYRKVNVEEIARHAHVAKGTVYLYFKNKADLLIHAIAEEKKRYIVQLRPVFEGDHEPKERLRQYLKLAFVLANEMPLVSRLMRGDREIFTVLEEMEVQLKDRTLAMQHEFVIEMLDQAARPHRWTRGELMDRTMVLLSLLYNSASITDERLRGGMSMERFAEILANTIVDGLARSEREQGEGQ
jgi:AcrR family transcriptional regulator